MKTKLNLILTSLLFLLGVVAFAQQSVTGTVTDESGAPIPGATILNENNSNATTSDFDGNFTINAELGEELTVSYVGYNQSSIEVTSMSLNVTLTSSTKLDEVVVTGVSVGTSVKKLGFSLGKVSGEELQTVPGSDVANALRGKISGVRIVQPSGNPSSTASIRLRGSTSISGSQSPLILIDGIPSNGTRLSDIPVEDVQSIEVVKGSAGSAIYGSLAGNGAINIITKKGDRNQSPKVTISYEYSSSSLNSDYPTANSHMYKNDPEGVRNGDWDNDPSTPDTSNFGFLLSGGNRVLDTDANGVTLFDNPYLSQTYDATDIYTSQPNQTVTASVRGGGENSNYYVSYQNLEQSGILENVPTYSRTSFRTNFQTDISDETSLDVSAASYRSKGFSLDEQGQGGTNAFYSALIAEPFINLNEKDENGQYKATPSGYSVQGANFQNPNYFTQQINFGFDESRLVGGLRLNHKFSDDLSFDFVQSIDKRNNKSIVYYPDGFQTTTPSATLNDGSITESADQYSLATTNANIRYTLVDTQDLSVDLVGSANYLKSSYESLVASGYEFIAKGVINVENTVKENQSLSSERRETVQRSLSVNSLIDYKDKLILDALIKNDESSLYGEDERSRVYGRGSLTYRISEDFDLGDINEMKIRASYGTSGSNPSFYAQYETFSVTASGISPGILGNKNLLPSVVAETEVGINLQYKNNFNFELTYSDTNVKDDVILVPLSGVAGYSAQFQNIGEINTKYIEASLGGELMNKNDMRLSFNLNFDTGTQEITNLGDVPAYTRSGLGAVDIFRVEAGKPYGTMYGYQYATSLSDLTVTDGVVMNNAASNALAGGQHGTDAYSINEHGYVVHTADIGTSAESPLVLYDSENSQDLVSEIGNTNPDFNVGFSTNFKYNDFGLYMLIDYQHGGDIYNYTRQLMYYNVRHGDLPEYASLSKDQNYAQNLYYQSRPNSHFVEDGTYMKLREIALSYDINNPVDFIDRIGLKVSGINLLTITDYTGWDPEVAISTNPTNFRLDEYSYPNFSTFLTTVTINF